MLKNDIQLIFEASKTKTLTFFVGAGISKLSGVPTWSELIDAFCDELKIPRKSEYSSEDYLSIPQKYYYHINQDDGKYYSFIEKTLKSIHVKPNQIHDLMYLLNPQNFITTNFDDLLEKAAVQNYLTYKTIASDADVPNINGDRYILKVHGDILHRNIVLKEEDYLNYSENFKLIETILKSIFSTNTVVFIGYRLNDYNIKLVLNWTKNLLKGGFKKPFFFYTEDTPLSAVDVEYQESRGLSIIDFRDFFDSTINVTSIPWDVRYTNFLKEILAFGEVKLRKRDKKELFDILYQKLEPLSHFKALKIYDINKQLYPYLIVEENGWLRILPDMPNLIELFCEFNFKKIDLTDQFEFKYQIVCEVFQKAFVKGYIYQDEYINFNLSSSSFGDNKCFTFDYLGMEKYIIDKSRKDLEQIFKKAFYLAKLKRYKESYELYKLIAQQSYSKKDYLVYYLAQKNKFKLYQAIKKVNQSFMFLNSISITETDKLIMEITAEESIF